MINSKKRRFSLFASAFAFVCAVGLIVINGVLTASMLMAKPNQKTLIEKIGISSIQKNYIAKLSKADASTFKLMCIALLIMGIVLFILGLRNIKNPVKKNGVYTYRKFNVFLTLALAAVVVVIGYMQFSDKKVAAIRVMKYFCYFYMISGGFSCICALISMFFKGKDFQLGAGDPSVLLMSAQNASKAAGKAGKGNKNGFNTANNTTMITSYNSNPYALAQMPYTQIGNGFEEKLLKMKQLRDAGIITETQYNAAVVRLLNSL